MGRLTHQLVGLIPDERGLMGEVVLVEPNGEEHFLTCLIRHDGITEITESGDGSVLRYLNQRYTSQSVWAHCRAAIEEGQESQE